MALRLRGAPRLQPGFPLEHRGDGGGVEDGRGGASAGEEETVGEETTLERRGRREGEEGCVRRRERWRKTQWIGTIGRVLGEASLGVSAREGVTGESVEGGGRQRRRGMGGEV